MGIDYNDRLSHFGDMPVHTLLALALNESAIREYRKYAVELLISKNSPLVKHPGLALFVQELAAALPVVHESEAIAPTEKIETPEPAKEEEFGPHKASVTIASLNADAVVENE